MVNFSESFLQFLNEKTDTSRVAALIMKAHWEHARKYPKHAYTRIITNKEVDYITMRPNGMLSYLPAGKSHKVNERGEWQRDGRQEGKPGKVIRKVFTEKILRFIPAKEFESFGNAYKAKFMDNGFRFEIRSSKEIGKIYCMRRAEGDSSLNQSCMNGDRDYMAMYEACKDLRILILLNKDNELCGRALLWNISHDTHGDMIFLDRFYVVEDYMYDLFVNHAQENKWWYKVKHKSRERATAWINPANDQETKVIATIKLNTEFDEYPYIDTFHWGDDGSINNDGDGCYTYDETGGGRSGGNDEEEEDDHSGQLFDEFADEWINEDDAVYLCNEGAQRYRNRYVHSSNAIEAYIDGSTTGWFHGDDDNATYIRGSHYYINHSDVICRADGDYDLLENCVTCETDGEYYVSDSDELIMSKDGEYFHKENDSDVVYVQPTKVGDRITREGQYFYLPDNDGDVVRAESTGDYYWSNNRAIKMVMLKVGTSCSIVHERKIDLIKFRKRYYHIDDSRLVGKKINLLTRAAI